MVLGDAVLTYCDQYDLFIQQYDSMQCTTACPARDVTIISMFLSGIQPTSALSSYDFSGYDDWHQFVTFLRSLVFRCSREGTSFLYADFFRLPTAPRSCAQSLNPILICNVKSNQHIPVLPLTSRTVIVDSGAGVTTVPTPAYNSSNQTISNSTPLTLCTADDSAFSPSNSGIFRGIPSQVVPQFSDIILGLNDLLSAGNISICTDKEMTIIKDSATVSQFLSEFRSKVLDSVRFVAGVQNGVYSLPLDDLPLNLSDHPRQNSSHLIDVIHRYETAKFHTIRDLVVFFHDLLGHPSIDTMLKIVQSSSVDNLPSELTSSAIRKYFPFNCPTCPASQLAQRPAAPLLPSVHLLPGEEFEVDFKGPWTDASGVSITSFSGNKYSFTGVDANFDFAYASFARTPKNPVQYLEKLRLFIKKKTGNLLKVIRVGDEFMKNKSVHAWATQPEVSVTLLPSIPYEHDRLTKVERLHRTLQDMVNKCLHGKPHLGSKYWEKAYRHCIDLYNIRPRAALSDQSPYQVYYNRPYDFKVNPMFPFGSIVMGHIPLDLQHAMSGRANEMFFEGIAHDYNNGIKLYNPETKTTVTRHTYAYVDDKEPTASTYIVSDQPLSYPDPPASSFSSSSPKPVEAGSIFVPPPSLITSEPSLLTELDSIKLPPSSPMVDEGGPIPFSDDNESLSAPGEGGPTPLSLLQDTALDDINRWTHKPLSYQDAPKYLRPSYDNIGRKFTDLALDAQYEIVDICKSSSPEFKTIYTYKFFDTSIFATPPSLDDLYEYEHVETFLQDANYRFDTKSFPYLRRRMNQVKAQLKLGMPTIPLSVEQAQVHQYSHEFMTALDEEVSSLWGMSTWKAFGDDPKSIPPGRLIGSKIIFDIVYNPDGTFKKFKARLVARGDQLKSNDTNNFAGTIKSETMRILLAVVAEHDLDHDSLDVKTAFLYPSLKPNDTTWLRRPKGLTDKHMPPIVELLKSIYGLPKASQYFEEYLSDKLLNLGFKRTISDKQLFILKRDDGSICYASTHVDDIFLACTKDSGLNDWVRDQFAKVFTLTHRPNTTVILVL